MGKSKMQICVLDKWNQQDCKTTNPFEAQFETRFD